MRMFFARWFIPYIVVSVVHLTSLVIGAADVAHVTKVALMPMLIFAIFRGSFRRIGAADFVLIGALFFAWMGDIFVSDAGSSSFAIGLGAFLVTHIVYFLLFVQSIRTRRIPWQTSLLLVWWVGMLVLLRDDLGIFLVPLAVYGFALGASTAAAFATSATVATGACLFLASDTSLAWALFAPTSAWWNSDAVIMFLYILGQLLIVWGFLRVRVRTTEAGTVTG